MDLAEIKSNIKTKIDRLNDENQLYYLDNILTKNNKMSSVTNEELNELINRRQNVLNGSFTTHEELSKEILNENSMG